MTQPANPQVVSAQPEAESKTKTPYLPVLNIVAYLAVVVINALANILPLNGLTTGEISDRFPSLFTPAGYVFAIWGLIYVLLGIFVVYQALPAQRDNPTVKRLGYLFVISCALNIAWLLTWHYLLIPITLPVMLGLLVSLILCYERLEVGRSRPSRWDALALHLPFSVYLGWISVATVANVSVFFLDLDVRGGWLAPLWAAVAIVAATLIGLQMLRVRRDRAFVGVLIWAFLGIAVRQWGSDVLVVLAALGALGYLAYALWQPRVSLVRGAV